MHHPYLSVCSQRSEKLFKMLQIAVQECSFSARFSLLKTLPVWASLILLFRAGLLFAQRDEKSQLKCYGFSVERIALLPAH